MEQLKGDQLKFVASGKTFTALEVGKLVPGEIPVDVLRAGEIGYIVTGIKEPGVATVGDTLILEKKGQLRRFRAIRRPDQ